MSEQARRNAQTISYPAAVRSTSRSPIEAADPHVVVLFGATGDLARRKLLPGLAHLDVSELAPEMRLVATSLDDLDDEGFRAFAKQAFDEFTHRPLSQEQWDQFAATLTYVPQAAGPEALAKAVAEAEAELEAALREP